MILLLSRSQSAMSCRRYPIVLGFIESISAFHILHQRSCRARKVAREPSVDSPKSWQSVRPVCWGFSLTYRECFTQLFSGLSVVCNLWFSLHRDGICIQLAFAFRRPSSRQLQQKGPLEFMLLWFVHGEHLAPRFRCIIFAFGSPVRNERRKLDLLAATIYVLINIGIIDKLLTERAFHHGITAFHGY